MAEVTPHDFLAQQGATFVVFHPCGEQLVLGLGCSEQPAVVPHCVAYGKTLVDQARSTSPTAVWPHQQAYEALLQVQRTLHLPPPPKPSFLQQPQQAQHDTTTNGQADVFPAAKAGLISQKQIAEGSDGFIWLDDQQQQKLLQRQQPSQQQQQQQKQQQQQQQQQQKLPCFAGGQVPALWPPDAYEAHWLMTPDNHIAGLDSLPLHVLLDRFEATWGWALHQLGLPRARWRHLSAVLAVPMDMTAAEVRLFADLLLGRLGFAALVVHLEPVAACFGNGTTSACVINVGSSSCTVCCVDDAVVLPPVTSRYTLPYGLVDIAGALTGWMACYGHWPVQLQQRGMGFSGSAGYSNSSSSLKDGGDLEGLAGSAAASSRAAGGGLSPDSVYSMLLLEDLVLQQCYFPKENYQPGLLGQPMLEDQQAAVVPVRMPGQPTTNYNVSLGSWAAAAAMTLFFPDLAPIGLNPAHQAPGHSSSGSPAPGQHIKQEEAAQGAAAEPQAAAAPGSAAMNGEPRAVWLHRRYHAGVHDLPAAEALYMQSQLKVRLEAGETGVPPDGMYLLPSELAEKPVGAAAAAAGGGTDAGGGIAGGTTVPQPASSAGSSRQNPQVPEGKVAIAGAAAAGGGGGAAVEGRSSAGGSKGAAAAAAPIMGLDEAVFRSIMGVSAGRAELMSRLAAGLLLVGPGGGLRGLGSMLERRVGVRFNTARQPQIVSSLEPRAEPAHVAWKGAALLAALDSGRENWLPRHQWVDGGMVLPAPLAAAANAAIAAAGGKGSAAGKKAAAAVGGGVAAGAAGGAGSGGPAGAGAGSNSTAAAGRHTKLFYYCRAEQGML